MLARQTSPSTTVQPLALENVLLGVQLPYGFVLQGLASGTTFTQAGIGIFFNIQWILPTLPDPYAANIGVTTLNQQTSGLIAAALWGPPNDVVLQFTLIPSVPAGQSPVAPGSPTSSTLQTTQTTNSSLLFQSHATPSATAIGYTALLDRSRTNSGFARIVSSNLRSLDVFGSRVYSALNL